MNSSGGTVARYAQTTNIDEPLAESSSRTTSYYEADGAGKRLRSVSELAARQIRAAFIGGFLVLVTISIAGWQIAASYVANYQLQDDINDLAAQPAARVGLSPLASPNQLCSSVIAKAKDHGIKLEPKQVTAQITTTPDTWTVYLAADYEAPVNMLVFSFPLHFMPSSLRKWAIKRA